MITKVLDAWALMAYFEDEPAAPKVKKILLHAEHGGCRLLLCAINWGEIYYNVMRNVSQETAEDVAKTILEMAIEIVPVERDMKLVRQAAIYKATKKISYADGFAAALAKIYEAELVTGDPDFKQFENEIDVDWLS